MREATCAERDEAIMQLHGDVLRLGVGWYVEDVYVDYRGWMIVTAYLYIHRRTEDADIIRDATSAEWDEILGLVRDPGSTLYLGTGWRVGRIRVYPRGGMHVTAALYLPRRPREGEPT